MKTINKTLFIILLQICCINSSHAQFGNWKEKVLNAGTSVVTKKLGAEEFLKAPAAITTSFEDVNRTGSKMPDFQSNLKPQPLYLLPKAAEGGYILCEGLFEMTNKSYCLKAGTYAPSKGDGYMYAPTLGPKKDLVISILKNAERHPEIHQQDIQVLLWAIIARTRFADMSGKIKATAVTLLSTTELAQMEGGAFGVLPASVVNKAKDKLPKEIQAVFEAENNIRKMVASGNSSFAEMEKYAILAGMATPLADSPSGIWTLHPKGYYLRYFPYGYSQTRTQIYIPKELMLSYKDKSLIYDATNDIACPANTGAQRLAQTNEPINPNYSMVLKVNCKF